MMGILLNKNKSKKSVNRDLRLKVDLSRGNRLLPLDKITTSINEEELYQKEREECNTIRLVSTINPICSNVLHNKVTEIVKNEGSNKVVCLNMTNNKINYRDDLKGRNILTTFTDAIRDTQLSGVDGYCYHCGIDMFNNHIFRSQTFKSVCQTSTKVDTFNTLNDMMRTATGGYVKGYKDDEATWKNGNPNIRLHLYRGDEVLSFEESIKENLVDKDGWIGFHNASKMKTYSGRTLNPNLNDTIECLAISNVINNKQACEFISLAPEKDLFSFTPKYNKDKNRLEKNWHYYITYPSSSTTNVPYIRKGTNSLKIVYFDENTKNSGGKSGIKIYSVTKHGLNVDDVVNIYNGDNLIIKNSHVIFVDDDYTFTCERGGVVISNSWIDVTKDEWDELTNSVTLDSTELPFLEREGGNNNVECSSTDSAVSEKENVTYRYTFDVTINLIMDVSKRITVEEAEVTATAIISGYYNSNTATTTSDVNVKLTEVDGRYTGSTIVYKKIEAKKDNNGNVIELEKMVGYKVDINLDRTPLKKYTCYVLPNGSVNLNPNTQDITYKQVVSGEEVEYYVRIFSHLPNWRFAKEKPTAYNIYKDGSSLIKDNQVDFENHISNLAFAKNAYGDDITQIVFTDDINIGELKDNLGRPLTEIYLTLLKNNKGYKEWYNTDNWNNLKLKTGLDIEYSHMFGKLNCGFNLSPHALKLEDEKILGHITRMSNVGSIVLSGLTNINNHETDEIDILNDKDYYGDLCCLSRVVYAERVIDDAMFRFNTAQRELGENCFETFKKLSYDEITCDDYDNYSSYDFMTTYTIPSHYDESGHSGDIDVKWGKFTPNQLSEGYCYKAHYKIPIKTYSNELESQYPKITRIKTFELNKTDNTTISGIITTSQENYFEPNDVFVLYDNDIDEWFEGKILSIKSRHTFECEIKKKCANIEKNGTEYELKVDNITKDRLRYRIIRKDSTIPNHALLTKDSTCRYVWRWILQNGNDSYSTNEVYPYTNGALYIHQNINVYVKRQDPNKYVPQYCFIGFDDSPFNIDSNKLDISRENNYKSERDIVC